VVLQHDSPGEAKTFATFPADPLPDVQLIFDACGDLADSLEESVRVAIVILDEDGESLAQTFHKQMPLDASSPDALNASEVSSNTIVAQLLRHIEVQQRAVTGSHVAIYDAFQRTLDQLQKTNERQNAQINALTEALHAAHGEASEETADTRAESIARTQAWERFAELGPVVTELLLKTAAGKMNGHASDAGRAAVNGAASVVD
jgi:hemoglobin-like flavoprotein